MAQPEPMPSGEVVGVVTGHHVPSHSRESSTSSTASAASICSNGGLIQTAEEEEEEHTSPMPIYSPLSKCSSPTANNIIANHSVIIFSFLPQWEECWMNSFFLIVQWRRDKKLISRHLFYFFL